MFKKLLGVLVVCLFLVACSEVKVDNSSDEDVKTEGTSNSRVEPNLDAEIDFDREAGKQEALQNYKEQKLLEDLRASLKQVDTQFVAIDKTYTMKPIDEAFIAEIFATINGSIDRAIWDEMVSTFSILSATIQEELGDGYVIVMLNPHNERNMLIAVTDGVVVYNIMNE